MNDCRCGKPTRDAAYMCDDCARGLEVALGDATWLDEQLEITITGERGVDYRRQSGAKGGKSAPRGDKRIHGDHTPEAPTQDNPTLGAHIQDDPGNMRASDARSGLKALLVTWALFCEAEHVRHQSPTFGLPADNIAAISAWLLWRIDGLALHELGSDAADQITDAVANCHRLIDRPADRQYLGECKELECLGRMWAKPSATFARCDTCQTPVPADDIRKRMLGELDDRLCTAAEIAHLSTYLGLKAGREQVRKRINQWSSRNQITVHPSFSDEPTFRFGEVYERLARDEYATKVG